MLWEEQPRLVFSDGQGCPPPNPAVPPAAGFLFVGAAVARTARGLPQAEPAMLGEFQKIMDLADMKATG